MNSLSFQLLNGQETLSVQAKEDWKPGPKKNNITRCRFMVRHNQRWYRLYADHTPGLANPHFICSQGKRLPITNVCP